MDIYTIPSTEITVIQNVFCHQAIESIEIDLFNNNLVDFSLIRNDSALCVISFTVLKEVLDVPDSLKTLLNFLSKNTHLLVYSDMLSIFYYNDLKEQISLLDNLLSSWKVSLIIDAKILNTGNLKNIEIFSQLPNWFEKEFPRPLVAEQTMPTKKDYILTIGAARKHRDILWDRMSQENLLSYGFCIYHKGNDRRSNWIGIQNFVAPSNELYASADLYHNSNFELLTESLYEDGYFITEKTIKPIAMCHPFLILSTPGYLEYLHSKGFKTFGSLISEDYDYESNLEKRVELIIEQLKYILNKGSNWFHNESRPITDHNYQTLSKITGSWWNCVDKQIVNILQKIAADLN